MDYELYYGLDCELDFGPNDGLGSRTYNCSSSAI